MPEPTATIDVTAPAETPPTPPPAAPEPRGIDALMAGIERAATTPEKPKGEPAAKTPVAKPAAPPAEPKPADPAKPVAPKEDAGSLRRRVEELNKSEKVRLTEIESLKKQNQELSGKRFVTPEMEQEIEANKKQMAELRQQISEVSYERSDDFDKQFKQPWDASFNDTLKKVQQMRVENESGESRPATEADFLKVASAPYSDRAAIAQQLFGVNAMTVLNRIDRLETIKESADKAIKDHRAGWEVKQKESAAKHQENQKAYVQHRDNARKELGDKYPEFFADDPNNPEISKAWKDGQEFVDGVAARADDMPIEELAAHGEVVRARAAWFVRGHKELTQAKGKIASLEAELAKYRGADPGADTKLDARGEKPAAKDDVAKGIEGLGERMERIARGEA